jgi:hypothetical protein
VRILWDFIFFFVNMHVFIFTRWSNIAFIIKGKTSQARISFDRGIKKR